MEVRRIKARVDDERLPRGADPHTHLKLGRGGLADIEWTVQLLQMRHAGAVPGLRTPRTLDRAAGGRGGRAARAPPTPSALAQAWRTVSRSATPSRWSAASRPTSCRATPASRPRSPSVLGYPPGESDEMVNDYLRTTRRARAVVERVFWD